MIETRFVLSLFTDIFICNKLFVYFCVCLGAQQSLAVDEYALLLVHVAFLVLKLSLSSLAGIEQDAVNTFTKYISPDAAKPIPITEAMRNDIIGKQCLKLWPKKRALFGY